MRIDRLYLRDVGPFREAELEFPPGDDPSKADVYMFVGQNGSGKSTLLEGIAQLFTSSETATPRRLRTEQSIVAALVGEHLLTCAPRAGRGAYHLPNSMDTGQHTAGEVERVGDAEIRYPRTASAISFQVRVDGTRSFAPSSIPPVPSAVFGYGASRTVERSPSNPFAPNNPDDNPLHGAASLAHVTLGAAFARWVATADARHALSLRAGDHVAAGRAVETLGRLEAALCTITDRRLKFSLEPGTLAVQLELDGVPVALDLLPEGLKALLAWLGDLFMRMERLRWVNDAPLVEQPIVLLLDEVDVHQHPVWQRRIVPTLQELFPNAQIFLATHSPFVVASARDAFIYPITLDPNGVATVGERLPSLVGHSYPTVLREVFGIDERFDIETERALDAFYALRDDVLRGQHTPEQLHDAAVNFPNRSPEIDAVLGRELRALERRAQA